LSLLDVSMIKLILIRNEEPRSDVKLIDSIVGVLSNSLVPIV